MRERAFLHVCYSERGGWTCSGLLVSGDEAGGQRARVQESQGKKYNQLLI